MGAVTVITSTLPRQLGKAFALDSAGHVVKNTAGQMIRGSYEVRSFDGVRDLVTLLSGVSTSQALCASLPKCGHESGALVSRALLAETPGAIARTLEHWHLPSGQPGVLILDFDPPKSGEAFGRDELWQVLLSVAPGVADGGAVWWCSGSSLIYNDGQQVAGVRGQRVYLLMQDLSDTKRTMEVLEARCWLAGLGRIEVSDSGALLERAVFDSAMSQPARLDFIGGAVCKPPLTQERGLPVILSGGGFIDTREAFPELTPDEAGRVAVLIEEAKAKAKPEATQRRQAWKAKRVADGLPSLMSHGVSAADAEDRLARCVDAAFSRTLLGDLALTVFGSDGLPEVVTVDHVLSHRDRYNLSTCLDPLNPSHRGGSADGILYLQSASPVLYSFDDGGVTYWLRTATERIESARGQRGDLVDQVVGVLDKSPDVFMTDAGPVLINSTGRALPLTAARLQLWVGTRLALFSRGKGGASPMDLPREVAELVLAGLAY
jgi:hypothetical protein